MPDTAGIMKVSSLPSQAAKGYNLINKLIKLHFRIDWAACPTASGSHPEPGMARDHLAPA